ncbi:MAG: tRNA N6-adenosine threonylcarbamoyltransferase [Chlamydiales bacterium]|nr:tRNA N6-adenosine threonylcarbamoyltransferase [Chlamydiales bacterium]MCH9635225.1 tRNA N6-adenosine threonylcarbamoyltransferase [Chlamydiales bacterium]MCH9703448.1 tRNA (adenosine(37)-N6)-threonylcarbamoyltransferase complex transferase subunit TsaD [Chlamydiota bacterium]
MLVLGIETTCDETAVAIVEDGKKILVNLVATQKVHEVYGGVVPELACRRHIDMLRPLVEQALETVPLEKIDLIAVAHAPGLIGALLIGLNFAKTLSMSTGIPFVGVNHVEAHLYASMMEDVPLPALGIVLSGGHTELLLIEKLGQYKLIGKTHDDAIGEAFDKAAKLLDLPYPGGPEIEKLAKKGEARFDFKPGRVKRDPYAFSFSGLKTALLYQVKGQNGKAKDQTVIGDQERADVAASFQEAAFDDVCEKAIRASQEFCTKCMVLGGGVTANMRLREKLQTRSDLPLFFPPPGLSLDNGAMIAGLGYHIFNQRGADDLDLLPHPRIELASSRL